MQQVAGLPLNSDPRRAAVEEVGVPAAEQPVGAGTALQPIAATVTKQPVVAPPALQMIVGDGGAVEPVVPDRAPHGAEGLAQLEGAHIRVGVARRRPGCPALIRGRTRPAMGHCRIAGLVEERDRRRRATVIAGYPACTELPGTGATSAKSTLAGTFCRSVVFRRRLGCRRCCGRRS